MSPYEKSFTTIVGDSRLTITTQSLADDFELSQSGVSIFTYRGDSPNAKEVHRDKWRCPKFDGKFKLGSTRGSLKQGPPFMMDIINKIIVQDIDAQSELSTPKYKPMMALDDGIEANWVDYIFD